MAAWALGCFYFFMSESTPSNWVPLLIWSYGIATGPWVYMAQKESQSGSGAYSSLTAFFLQIACIVVMVMISFFHASLININIGYWIVMGLGLIFQFYLSLKERRLQKQFEQEGYE